MGEAIVRGNMIVLPGKIIDLLGLSEGDALEVKLEEGKIILKPLNNPFRILREILSDFTYDRYFEGCSRSN